MSGQGYKDHLDGIYMRFGDGRVLVFDPATTAIQLRALFDNQCGRHYLAFDIRSAAEHHFLTRENVAFDCSVYLRNRHLDHGLSNLGPGANDESAVR